jgi:hypothetical protein
VAVGWLGLVGGKEDHGHGSLWVDDARDERRRGDPEGRSPVAQSFHGRQWCGGRLLQAVARTG